MNHSNNYPLSHEQYGDSPCRRGGSLSRNEMRFMARKMIAEAKREEEEPEYHLTHSDKRAWWAFLKMCLFENFKRADLHDRCIKADENIGDLEDVSMIRVNDYFELYGLPRVTAKNGEIRVNDEVKVKYLSDEKFHHQEEILEIIDNNFCLDDWKREQLEKCQNHKCAFCEKKIYLDNAKIKSIKPLIFGGKVASYNHVLVCEDCCKLEHRDKKNWYELGEFCRDFRKPQWIIDNGNNSHDRDWKMLVKEAERELKSAKSAGALDYRLSF